MNAIALAILAGVLAPPNSLPNSKTPIDTLTYTFGGAGAFGAGGSLSITAEGKVRYSHQTAPHTGSGGKVTQKEWTLTKDEKAELFRRLVDDGLLEVGEPGHAFDGIQVTSGRWRATVKGSDKVANHLRPLLAKAHPAMWAEKAPPPREPKPKPGVLQQFNYYFATKAEGDHALLYLSRNGDVSYQRYSNTGKVTTTHVQTAWTIPAADAAAILDVLAAGGVLDLEDVGTGKFPTHRIEARAGRWWTTFYTKELPEKFTKPLLPFLKKADAEFWK